MSGSQLGTRQLDATPAERMAVTFARVLRGGSWYFDAFNARAAYRLNFSPDVRDDFVGFRVVRSSPISVDR